MQTQNMGAYNFFFSEIFYMLYNELELYFKWLICVVNYQIIKKVYTIFAKDAAESRINLLAN